MKRKESPEDQGWQERPGLARMIRGAAFVTPIAISLATGYVVTGLLPSPPSTLWGIVRWAIVALASLTAMVAAERIARRVVPLATLFKLGLAFPDQVPSRLGLAMKIGTTSQLKKRIEEHRVSPDGELPGDAARRLLELVGLLSRHDRMTRGHSERVRGYAHMIGVEMGITGRDLDRLRWAALLHDIGKIDVPGSILNKPDRLTDDEFEIIKSHPLAGKAYVQPLARWIGESVRAVWEHHERFDGGGYPNGLSGTRIAMASRIVSVADAYDVMTSTRSYKDPMTSEAARAELSKHAGTQFDPDVVRAFLNASLGATSRLTRPSRWLSQAALLPQAIVTQVGAAIGPALAVVAVGTTAGAAGVVANATQPTETVFVDDGEITTTEVDVDERSNVRGANGVASPGGSPTGSPSPAPGATLVEPAASETDSEPPTSDDPGSPAGDTTLPDPVTTVRRGPTTTDPSSPDSTPPSTSGPVTTVGTQQTTTTSAVGTQTTTTVAGSSSTTTTSVAPAPGTTTPGITLPEITLPEITLPEITLPDIITLPEITLPDIITLPEITLPDIITLPEITLPDIVTLPEITLPDVTLPDVTLPVITLPEITLPKISLPDLGL
ncbi:HD-GYP domain-containing protein [Ilumatobacter coccineus]|nr:HD-GYP domain-containing protein [Ilumatobacter coccineus]